ncbi:hypothetical protein WR25_05815 [Diploscapter pachys]|uniref:GH18 domain-containing protein n=1 Tax=Diploscapter pachys TaxID=2018661 RepID=A0A2A2M173_9BILA|nr:hypothetical protein WR25_05815 [Diploscapter pachys]
MRVRVRIVTMKLSWKLFLARNCSDGGRERGEQLTATLLRMDAAHLPDLPFIGVYYDNTFDMDSLTTISNAAATGIGLEPLFIPDILSKVPAKTQIMNLYNALNDYNVKIQRLWVQVRDQNQWMATPFGLQQNLDFFNETIYTARNLTWKIGVFTTKQDWQTIMGNSASQDFYQSAANLWYTNTTGNGTSGETTQDFSDFTNFGIWSTSGNTMPNVKQFGVNENVCKLNVNRQEISFKN